MKVLFWVVAGSLVTAASAAAQQASIPSWAGLYVGIEGGPNVLSNNRVYGFGGLRTGYDVERDLFVIGAELSADYRPEKADNVVFWTGASGTNYQTNNSESSNFVGSATIHFGYEVTDRLLPYIAAGVAFSPLDMKTTLVGLSGLNAGAIGTNSSSTERVGWAAGGGLRTAITDHWSMDVQYRYYSFSTETLTTTAYLGGAAKAQYTLADKGQGSLVSLGANYRFW
ncbi:MAG TPA: outer membrane beta-barrel protein [Micropepsaceae bacterium]|nr:outer membrane beta-barrel protein [Micropepsaceae bacterium]